MDQQTMYPGVVNSPMTELATAINSDDTTISLIDASVLPEGINQATIGNGADAETILYTAKDGNDLTGVTRGFQGSAKSWVVGAKVARKFTEYDYAALKGNTEAIAAEVVADDPVEVSFVSGTQIVNSPRKSRVTNIGMDGRTLVNPLGRDGNCESLTPFTLAGSGGTVDLSTTQKKSGSNSLKATLTSQTGYRYKDYSYTLDASKQYILAAWVYIDSWTAGLLGVYLCDNGGTTIRYSANADTSKVGSWQLISVKVPIENSLVGSGFRVRLGGNSTGTFVAYIDSIRIFELSAADSDAIGTTYTTDEEIDAFLPYVDGMKHVEAVHITNLGKNLASNSPAEWESGTININTGANANDSTRLRTVGYIPVVAGQTYFYMAQGEGFEDTGYYIYWYDENKSFIAVNGSGLARSAPANAKYARFNLKNIAGSDLVSDDILTAKVMFNLGETSLPFEPQRESHLYMWDMELASNPDGSVADRQYMDENGKPRVTRRFDKPVLDGSLAWEFVADGTGFKRVRALISPTPAYSASDIVVKYDGKIIGTGTTAADQFLWDTTSSKINITIADIDSGWGEGYTPSAAERNAYFYGYKLYGDEGISDTSIYTTGTKKWAYRNSGGTWSLETTGTPPTTSRLPNDYWKPYRLQYELSQSIDEAVTHEGELMLHDGDNQVSMGTGIVVREPANFQLNNGNYHIGLASVSASYPKYRVSKFVSGYKDGDKDIFGIVDNAVDAYGNQRAYLTPSRYDPTAAYSITYEALDKYLIGIAPQMITGEVVPNIKEAVDDLTRGLVETKTAISVLQNVKISKQQPQVIAPTLLNGWVNLGAGNASAGYYKNESNEVKLYGLIKSGTLDTTAFYLPAGYRPKEILNFVALSANALGKIIIKPSGEVILSLGSNASFSLDSVSFRAEL